MLLQRLYNWIKYKSLPTSFLFRNRLFIERNTKHRRIYSIFGALMRNSKWGNFELSNVKYQFRFNYTRYLLWTLLFTTLFLLAWFFRKYYAYTYAFNGVALFVWLSLDAFDYYLSFSLWCITAAIALTTNWVYSYFLEQTNLRYPPLKKIFSDVFFEEFTKPEEVEERQLLLGVSDLKYFFYHWISDNQNIDNLAFLEKLFDTEINVKWWGTYYDFFIKLFKATHLCNLNNELYSTKHLHYSLNSLSPSYLNSPLKKLISYRGDLGVFDKYTTILFWYTLTCYSNYHSWKNDNNPSLRLLRDQNKWNLGSFDTEISRYNMPATSVLGSFYLSVFTFNKLAPFSTNFSELWNFSVFIKNQINAAKWNRWLYKYSILHRKFLRNSHKITLTKKLFASGFYDNKFFNRNTWNAAHMKKIDKNLLHNLGSIYYKNLFKSSGTSLWQSPSPNSIRPLLTKKSITLFSFYENSYLWVAKRFYCFNTIPSNLINSTFSLSLSADNTQTISLSNSTTWHSTLTSYLRKLYLFNIGVSDISSVSPFAAPLFDKIDPLPSTHYYAKDLYLLFEDNDLMTLEFLDTNYWITNNSIGLKGLPNALNYCEFTPYLTQPYELIRFKAVDHPISFKAPCSVAISDENNYLFDVIFISHLY